MRLKKETIAMLLASLVLAGGTTTVTNAATSTYTAYSLQASQKNNYTALHDKTTYKDFVKNEVTAVTNTTYVNFWAVKSGRTKISPKYKQGVATGSKKLNFSSDYNLDKGDEVGMGMENYQSTSKTAWVSGNVDFK